jgi:vitamin B12 transporter
VVPQILLRGGRFSPSLFKGNVFSTGGYSALYGQALSSVLLLESIDLPNRSEASASLTTVFVGAGFQNLAKNKKSSFGINYGYTNLLPYFSIVKQKPDYFAMPEFHSSDANFRIKTKKGGMIKYYTTFASSQLGLRNADIDSANLKNAFGLNNLNWYNNLSYRENLSNGWKMQLGLSYSTNVDKITNTIQNQQNQPVTTSVGYINNKNFALKSTQDLSQVRAVFEKRIKGISAARFGAEYWYANNKTEFNNYTSVLKDHFQSVFAEADIYVSNALAIKAGGRFEYSSILKKSNIAPRISLAYKAGNNAQMSLAYGEFYQKPENNQLVNNSTGKPLQIGYTKATHYLINYIKTTSLQTFRVEAYYKKYNNLVKTFPDTNTLGTGYAQGFELFWRDKKSIKNIDYWISYSYLDTKRDYPKLSISITTNICNTTYI